MIQINVAQPDTYPLEILKKVVGFTDNLKAYK